MIVPGQKAELSPRSTMVEHVYADLRQRIWSGALAPGEKLVIDRLAGSFGVSITPVREALRRLQLEGLVTDLPYRGTYVAKATEAELRELFAVRGVLEGYALAQGLDAFTPERMKRVRSMVSGHLQAAVDAHDVAAFRTRNHAFHEQLLGATATGKLRSMVFDLIRNTERYRLLQIELDRDYIESAQTQHWRLLELLEQRRPAEIESLSRIHALTYVDYLARAGGLA
ncbi:MAG: GntR family transcriptional regulator [Candidatus Dormiibacterota bacterium]